MYLIIYTHTILGLIIRLYYTFSDTLLEYSSSVQIKNAYIIEKYLKSIT